MSMSSFLGRGAGAGSIRPLVAVAFLCAAGVGAASGQETPSRDTWDAVFISNVKVGSINTKVTPLKHQGRDLLRVEVTTELTVKRENDRATIRMRYGAIETPEGRVLRLDSRTRMGVQDIRVSGELTPSGDEMELKLEAGGKTIAQKLPWGEEVRGPYGPELGMAAKPMKPGETRAIKMFIPQMNQLAMTTLKADRVTPVEIYGQTRNLLRVESRVTDLDGKPLPGMDTVYFTDEKGDILRTETDVYGGMVTVRTTRQAATARGGELDVINATVVKTRTQINNPYNARYVVYNVTFKDGAPGDVIAADARQTLEPGPTPNSARLTVRTIGPADGEPGPAAVAPEYLEAGPLVNSQDPNVIKHMRAAVGNATDPWEKARRIQNWVHRNMVNKNFQTTFATASEVARDLSGDCTEHSVLAAAMCRAAGIPARVAIGLIYVNSLGGFGYHMWNEVYVNGRWVAIDASFDQNEVDAVHIKLSDSSLKGVSPFDQFNAVVQTSNKLTIDPIELR